VEARGGVPGGQEEKGKNVRESRKRREEIGLPALCAGTAEAVHPGMTAALKR
jgi:hypothetical protein